MIFFKQSTSLNLYKKVISQVLSASESDKVWQSIKIKCILKAFYKLFTQISHCQVLWSSTNLYIIPKKYLCKWVFLVFNSITMNIYVTWLFSNKILEQFQSNFTTITTTAKHFNHHYTNIRLHSGIWKLVRLRITFEKFHWNRRTIQTKVNE